MEFVLVMATGNDLPDEDLFEYIAPPKFDLDEFSELLEAEEDDAAEAANRTESECTHQDSSDCTLSMTE